MDGQSAVALTELDLRQCRPGVYAIRTASGTSYEFAVSTRWVPTVARHATPTRKQLLGDQSPSRLRRITALHDDGRTEPGMVRLGLRLHIDAERFWWLSSPVLSITQTGDAPQRPILFWASALR